MMAKTSAPPRTVSLLVLSSCAFAVAGIIGLWRLTFGLGTAGVVTSLASIAYWVDESPGSLRHLVDRVVATCSFVAFTAHAMLYVRARWIMALGWPCWLVAVASYFASQHLHSRGSHRWVYAHSLFHVSVAIGQALVIMGMPPVPGELGSPTISLYMP